jgi:hypothetical protein
LRPTRFVRLDGHAYLIRSEVNRNAGKVFQACGVAIPPTLRSVEDPEAAASEGDAGRVTTPSARL